MAILAFECANFTLSLALMTKHHTVFIDDFQGLRGQDQVLLPKVEGLMDKAGLSFQDLRLIVTTTGPGSFTGIRLALAAAHGLHLATGAPLKCLDSFTFTVKSYLRDKNPPEADILVCLESRRDEKYFQKFNSNGAAIDEPCMRLLSDIHDPGLHIGDGWGERFYKPSARDLVLLAEQNPTNFRDQCDPFYVRPPDVTVKS